MKEYAKTFYKSSQWIKTRNKVMKDNHYLCRRCSDNGVINKADIVHHIKEITPYNINDINITLNIDNLEPLCIECHNHIHYKKHMAVREDVTFDEEGNVIKC